MIDGGRLDRRPSAAIRLGRRAFVSSIALGVTGALAACSGASAPAAGTPPAPTATPPGATTTSAPPVAAPATAPRVTTGPATATSRVAARPPASSVPITTVTAGPETPGTVPQTFTIVSAYAGMGRYAAAADAEPRADRGNLYREYVLDSCWQACGFRGEPQQLAARLAPGTTGVADDARILGSSGVERLVADALQRAAALLPGPDTSACLFALDPLSYDSAFVVLLMHGVGGSAVAPGAFWLRIKPTGDWRDWVPHATAHEYHHATALSRYAPPSDLLAAMVFEGRADSFAHLTYPEIVAPWTTALTTEQEAAQWQAMQGALRSTDFATIRRVLFGGGETPRWTGYTIGFHIVQAFLRAHPGMGVEEWSALDPHELLAASGYDGTP